MLRPHLTAAVSTSTAPVFKGWGSHLFDMVEGCARGAQKARCHNSTLAHSSTATVEVARGEPEAARNGFQRGVRLRTRSIWYTVGRPHLSAIILLRMRIIAVEHVHVPHLSANA